MCISYTPTLYAYTNIFYGYFMHFIHKIHIFLYVSQLIYMLAPTHAHTLLIHIRIIFTAVEIHIEEKERRELKKTRETHSRILTFRQKKTDWYSTMYTHWKFTSMNTPKTGKKSLNKKNKQKTLCVVVRMCIPYILLRAKCWFRVRFFCTINHKHTHSLSLAHTHTHIHNGTTEVERRKKCSHTISCSPISIYYTLYM